ASIEEVRVSDAAGDTSGTASGHVDASAVGYALIIIGDNGNNILTGTAFSDAITGGGGDDRIEGGAGEDSILGGSGLDFIVMLVTAGNTDTIDAGNDGGFLALTGGLTNAATVDLNQIDQFTDGGTDTLIQGSFIHVDALTVTGFGLNIIGNDAGNTLSGSGQNDTIDGGTGDDALNGSGGNDTLTGGDGNDFLNGGVDDDNIDGGIGDDDIFGGPGNDVLTGGEDNDSFSGGAGNDAIDGGTGNDSVDYSSSGGVTVDLVGTATGDGNDLLTDIENVAGSNFADTLIGDGNANILNGNAGDDTLRGDGGDDVLDAGGGDNELDGGPGADTMNLSGFVTNDRIIYNALDEGAAAGANSGFDSVSGFQADNDKVGFATDANSALDDITDNDAFVFATNTAPNFTTTDEALLRTGVADAALTELEFATLLSNLNTLGVTAGTGDDGLIVAQGATQTGVYYYLEDGTLADNISASELTLLAIVNGQLGTGELDLL
ncbi:MAG: calcium-binding protein, partial [Terriglobia bacterium]